MTDVSCDPVPDVLVVDLEDIFEARWGEKPSSCFHLAFELSTGPASIARKKSVLRIFIADDLLEQIFLSGEIKARDDLVFATGYLVMDRHQGTLKGATKVDPAIGGAGLITDPFPDLLDFARPWTINNDTEGTFLGMFDDEHDRMVEIRVW